MVDCFVRRQDHYIWGDSKHLLGTLGRLENLPLASSTSKATFYSQMEGMNWIVFCQSQTCWLFTSDGFFDLDWLLCALYWTSTNNFCTSVNVHKWFMRFCAHFWLFCALAQISWVHFCGNLCTLVNAHKWFVSFSERAQIICVLLCTMHKSVVPVSATQRIHIKTITFTNQVSSISRNYTYGQVLPRVGNTHH